MAQTVTVTVKPTEELIEVLERFEASNVEALKRAGELIVAADGLAPFLIGDLDPVVVPRRRLQALVERRSLLAAALEPFLVDEEEATS